MLFLRLQVTTYLIFSLDVKNQSREVPGLAQFSSKVEITGLPNSNK